MNRDNIDHGGSFDWGKTSEDYARYRDIYPQAFYDKILELGLCTKGQRVLDLGTGTGVLPRNLYSYGACFVGVDASPEQIAQAVKMSEQGNMDIDYQVCAAEEISFPDHSFNVVTACQCFFYFDKEILLPKLRKILRPHGRLAILFMAWLPGESEIAARSEELVLRYNPRWTGGGMVRGPAENPEWAARYGFSVQKELGFDLDIPFTRESWNGRMLACRGIGASLSPEGVAQFQREHLTMLEQVAPESFEIPHYATALVLEN